MTGRPTAAVVIVGSGPVMAACRAADPGCAATGAKADANDRDPSLPDPLMSGAR